MGVLFLLVSAWALVPKVVQTLTTPKYRLRVDQAAPPPSAPTAACSTVLTAAVLAWCLLLAVDACRHVPRPGLRRGPRRDLLGVVLLLAPWVWVQVRGATLGTWPSGADLVFPAVVVAVWLVRPGRQHLRLLGSVTVAVAAASLLVGVLLPAQGVFRGSDGALIQTGKTLLPGGVLVGVFTHGNVLGQFLLMGLPFVALVGRPAVRTVLLAVVGAALVWSAARSALAGAVALALLVALWSVLPRARRRAASLVVLAGAWGLVAVLPFVTDDPRAFNGRGLIWAESLAAWREHPVVGRGSDFYAAVAGTPDAFGGTVYHGHNELVQLLVTGGVVLAVLVGLLLLVAVRRAVAVADRSPVGVAVLLAAAGASLLEVSLLLDGSGVFAPVLLLPLATLVVGEPPAEGDRGVGPVARRALVAVEPVARPARG